MAAIWHYLKSGQRQGPVTAAELKTLAENGQLLPDDMIWKEGMAGWEPARTVKGLFDAGRDFGGIVAGTPPYGIHPPGLPD